MTIINLRLCATDSVEAACVSPLQAEAKNRKDDEGVLSWDKAEGLVA